MAGLFMIRVIAQPLSLWIDAPFLPPFEHWQGSALPYWLLLVSQIVILFVLVRVATVLSAGAVRPRRRLGVWLTSVGTVYFALMAARLGLGLTVLSDHRWFASHLPAAFHMVLASFFLIAGSYHRRYALEA